MSELMDALKYRGPYEEAYQQSREAEIVNQQRVAQAQQMLQEARLKAEMQPYDIQAKQAQSEYQRALAQEALQRARTSSEDKYIDKIEKARQSKEQSDVLNDYSLLKYFKDTGGFVQNFQSVYDKLSPQSKRFFDTGGKSDTGEAGWSYSPEGITSAIDILESRHPELAKTLRNQQSIEGRFDVAGLNQQMANERKKWELELQEKRLKSQEAIKAQLNSIEKIAANDEMEYRKNPTAENRKKAMESMRKFLLAKQASTLARTMNEPNMESFGIQTMPSVDEELAKMYPDVQQSAPTQGGKKASAKDF